MITRRYDLDWLRVLAFGLLILYHVGMLYVTWGWHIKSEYTSYVLENVMLFTNQWRLSLLFLVSGLAAAIVLQRISLDTFTGKRLIRLMVPFVFAAVVVVPPQTYLERLQDGVAMPSYWDFFARFFRFEGAYWLENFTWNHMWFVLYLWVYSLLLVPLAVLLRTGPGQRLRAWVGRLDGWPLVLAPIVLLTVYGWFLRPHFPSTHALVDDWYNHALYFTIFVYGYLVGDARPVWDSIERLRRVTLCIGLWTFVVIMVMRNVYAWGGPEWFYVFPWRPLVYLNLWCWLLTLLGHARHYLNRPGRTIGYLNEAVFPFYILHQTLIIVAAYPLIGLGLGIATEAALVMVATFGGCLLIHELLIRRSRWLRPLFGLKPTPTRAAPPVREPAPSRPAP